MADKGSILTRLRAAMRPGPASRAERALQVLIVGSFVLPVSVFLVASWISYRQHYAEAQDRLVRTLGSVHEHAVKVFDTFEISVRYLEELTLDTSDEEIVRDEAEYSARLRNLIQNLPQLRDLWIIDRNGKPLVSGTVSPMPGNLDLSDRNYFAAHKNDSSDFTYVSRVVDARAAATNFFAITRKRKLENGSFNGVNLISIAPEYFANFYSTLPSTPNGVTALLRGDGYFLARYPMTEDAAPQLPPTSATMRAIAASPEQGTVVGISTLDHIERLFAYRKLPRFNVYVTSGIETAEIRKGWMRTMGAHLIFGIPATLAMIALGVLALRHTRRETLALARLREEIERRQTMELALRQAQKMEAVGRLTGGIAHDFNNLLTAILGNIDLTLRRLKIEDERVGRSLEAIRQAAQRATTLVQRLLTFSRQHLSEVKAVQINALVQGMSELLHRAIGETIMVETVLASGLWKTAVDPNQLENAILNLAVNARDAMPEGGRLTIETGNAYLDEAYAASSGGEIAAGQYVMLAVSDTGGGMSPEVREKVFEPFFTTKPAGVGSGLGLSMVYGFVKQSGGHIQIYSEVGHGTTLKLYFPRLAQDSNLPDWQESDGALPQAVKPRAMGGTELILLVEDDPAVCRYVSEALRELGYRVEIATNGADGLELIKKFPDADLLFTDVVLPGGMNGRELADKAHESRPELRVLFATGYTRNAIVHHGRLDPDVNLLTKPFTTDALARKVREILDRPAPA